VSIPRFFEFFIIIFLNFFLFLIFFKKSKNCHVSSCHRATWQWRGSDSDTCQYYARCHFLSLNLVPLF